MPNVGFHWYPQSETRAPNDEVEITVFDAKDGGTPILSFGESLPCREDLERDWLWEKRGRLLIISIPYRPGDHVATKLSDFEPVFCHLKYLHSFNKVHGDIRAFNMVFEKETAQKRHSGWLIDFDFGGTLGEKKYPTHYKAALDDGFRLGVGGKTITKFHDYYALWKVIGDAHNIIVAKNFGVSLAREELDDFFFDHEANGEKIDKAQELLSNFLTKYPETKLKVGTRFQMALTELSPPLDGTNKKDDTHAFNIVFGKETGQKRNGWLIDFDFGGTLGEKKYPAHYKASLDDGIRLGVGGKTITKFHDYYALWKVIDDAFDIVFEDDNFEVYLAKEKLKAFFRKEEANGEKIDKAQELLSDFLTRYPETKLTVGDRFQIALKELSPPLDDTTTKDDDSPNKNANTKKNVATGSLQA